MKVQIIGLILLAINIFSISAQRLIVQDDGAAIIDTYGMNSDVLALDPVIAQLRLKEGRTAPHSNKNHFVNRLITSQFEVAPTDATLDDVSGPSAMNWFQASGWNNNYTPAATGCAVYSGKDSSAGQWRVPTFYEALLIRVFKEELDKLDGQNGFVAFNSSAPYYTATGDDAKDNSDMCMYYSWGEDTSTYYGSMEKMSSQGRVRCIREINY